MQGIQCSDGIGQTKINRSEPDIREHFSKTIMTGGIQDA